MAKYLDLTNEADLEPTYNTAQIVAGIICGIAAVGVVIFGTLSLISSL